MAIKLPDGTPQILLDSPCESAQPLVWDWANEVFVESSEVTDVTPFMTYPIYLDFNGDGLLDIAALEWNNTQSKGIALWKGKPDNSYEQVAYLESTRVVSIHAADVNSDGRDDLLVRYKQEYGVQDPVVMLYADLEDSGFDSSHVVFRNIHNRGIGEPSVYDFNDDGLQDIVFVLGDVVMFIPQKPDGSFGSGYSMNVRYDRNSADKLDLPVRWFDLNNDGVPDMIIHARGVAFGKPPSKD
jgi:hypothetical protein